MLAAEGILTARGGLVSHAAVVARGWGKPAVVGAEALRLAPGQVTIGDVTIAEGEWLSIDGTNGTVVAGQVALIPADPPAEFTTLLALGRRDPSRPPRGAGQRRQRRRRGERPAARGRGHRAVPDRAHVPRRGPAAGRAPDDPGGQPGGRARRARAAAPGPARGLRRDPRRHGRAAGDGPAARPAAARVPAVDARAGGQARDDRARRRGAGSSTRPR